MWLLAGKFLLANWRAVLLAGLLIGILGWWWAHKAADNRMEIRAINAESKVSVLTAELQAIRNQLADADKAAKAAIAEKAEAEKAAAKRLKAREQEWRRIYGARPENRAWAETPVPSDIWQELNR